MTAEEFELLSVDEAEAILAEYTRLTAAGYSPPSALMLASNVELDLDLAARLVPDAPPALSLCDSNSSRGQA